MLYSRENIVVANLCSTVITSVVFYQILTTFKISIASVRAFIILIRLPISWCFEITLKGRKKLELTKSGPVDQSIAFRIEKIPIQIPLGDRVTLEPNLVARLLVIFLSKQINPAIRSRLVRLLPQQRPKIGRVRGK